MDTIEAAEPKANPADAAKPKMARDKIKVLFIDAMKSDWKKVVDIYKKYPEAYKTKITKSGDTAMHMAVSDGRYEAIEELVCNSGDLSVQNERGNTPLHLAAIMGSVEMCDLLARQDRRLIGVRNKDTETPLFLAVKRGKKDAFLRLSRLCNKPDDVYEYGRRNNNGETILHAAIFGEYFDIAFEIINGYPKFVDKVDRDGFSPLHVLANRSTAFRSGSQVRGWRKLIYHCTLVDELQQEPTGRSQSQSQVSLSKTRANYPENYQTCIYLFLLPRKIIRTLLFPRERGNNQQVDAEGQQSVHKEAQRPSVFTDQEHQSFPPNYLTCFYALKFLSKAMLVIFGLGFKEIVLIQEKKKKHTWSVQIMENLLLKTRSYEYDEDGKSPDLSQEQDGETTPYVLFEGGMVDHSENWIEEEESSETPEDGKTKAGLDTKETALLTAAKNGVLEMVKRILELFPVAIHDINSEKKNVVLLAVENRQPHIYNFLREHKMKETIFGQRDKEGNSALHLAAKLGKTRPWRIPGAALQMQWEIKWYQFVKSTETHFFMRYNDQGETPGDIFTESHKKLVKEGGEWLTHTSESCSGVAGLIATVAFATSSTVPGGVKEETGTPNLENHPAFSVFAIASLGALCFSVTSLVMFLSILTSRYEEKDFGKGLPGKLLAGMTSLFVSIASILVSFCAGHFFVLKNELHYAALPMYAVTCLPVTFYAIAQFPLYFDLLWATFTKEPQRRFK